MTSLAQTGSTALITWASRGFGRAIASALHAAGAEVVVVGRNGDLLASLRDELGDTVTTVVADAADPVVAGTLIELHRPDTLVLNAGVPPLMRPVQQQTWQTFSRSPEDVRKVTIDLVVSGEYASGAYLLTPAGLSPVG